MFESKSGRQAIMAKVVIDSTGDGDLLTYTGANLTPTSTPDQNCKSVAELLD